MMAEWDGGDQMPDEARVGLGGVDAFLREPESKTRLGKSAVACGSEKRALRGSTVRAWRGKSP